MTGLTASTAYDVYCAVGSVAIKLDDQFTAGFSSQPASAAPLLGGTILDISLTSRKTENVRCAVLANGATAPTAAEVNAGTGTGGAAVAATNGPVVAVVAASSATAGTAKTISYTGLTKNTKYDIYCATASGVLSSKLDVQTRNDGFNAAPTIGTYTATGFTVSANVVTTGSTRCCVYANNANAPSATQILAGKGAGDAAAGATNGPIASTTAPAAATATAGTAKAFVMTGLTASTAYDVYCAVGSVAIKLDDQFTAGFSSQPASAAPLLGGTILDISLTSRKTENVRCAVLANGATAPTAAEVNAGTGTGGAAVGATNGPVSIVVAASSATAGSAKTISQPQTVWNSVSGSGSGTATVCTASATADTVSLTWTESTQNNIRVRACTTSSDTSQTDNANVVLSTAASSSAAAGGNSTATGSASAASTTSSKVTQVYTFASLTPAAYTGNTKGNIECAYTCTVEGATTCSWCVAKATSPYRDYKTGISITSSAAARRSAKVTFVMSVATSLKSLSALKTLVAANSNSANFAAELTKVNTASGLNITMPGTATVAAATFTTSSGSTLLPSMLALVSALWLSARTM